MRPLPALSTAFLVAATLGCGSSKLEKATAERLIKPDYPAVVRVNVPKTATVDKGSEQQAKVQKINELLAKEPWFEIRTEEKDGKVRYSYQVSPRAPKDVKVGLKNFEAPAAMAEFVGAVRMEPMDPRRKDSAVKVTFLVKFGKPSGLWPLYEFLHPGAKLGQPVERHAQFERSGGKWGLIQTDESARIRE